MCSVCFNSMVCHLLMGAYDHRMQRGNVTIENAKAKEMAQEFEFEEVKGCNYGEPYDWRKKRHHVDEVSLPPHTTLLGLVYITVA